MKNELKFTNINYNNKNNNNNKKYINYIFNNEINNIEQRKDL